jgi:hypothetical protein
MQRSSKYLLAGCGATCALVIAYFVVGVNVPTTTAAPTVDPGLQTVNRTLKGDRQPIAPAFRLPAIPASKSRRNAGNDHIESDTPGAVPRQEVLLDGCEPLVSPIGQSPLAQVAGRCVS